MPLSAGTRLGPYEILTPLGAGGMGEVYRARDTRLDRDVAIKVLPELFAIDPERLTRFEREAKTLAALNHPNIAQIHGLEQSDGIRALVMELVEGEDLAASVARGPIPVADAVRIAKQIAEALDAAHERGIVHRDLKPANIMVTADGAVKVLDFGLAKAVDPAPGVVSNAANSPTFTSPATAHGVILGTAAYMAPEQAQGKPIDKRVDIWSFGVVLWEMLTGQSLFARDTVTDTLVAVLRDAPRLDRLPADTPPAVEELLRRCLERDPKLRLRDIGEARILLSQPLRPARTADGPPASRRRVWLSAAGAIALAMLAGAAAWYFKPVPAVPLRRFELPAAIAESRSFALSPDGARIAYISAGRLFIRALDRLAANDLGPVHVTGNNLFWSPDGRTIGFTAEGTIRTMPADGGPVFVVCRVPASARVMDAVWLTNGSILFSVWRDSLYTAPSGGGPPTVLLAVDPATEIDFHEISVLPDNRLIVSTHQRKDDAIVAELIDGTRRVVLTNDATAFRFTYVRPGILLFSRRATNVGLWAVPFSENPIDLSTARLVQPGATMFDVAEDGTLLFELAGRPKFAIVWTDRDGAMSATPGADVEAWRPDLALAPDGRRLAFIQGYEPDANVIVRDLTTGVDTRLTFNRAEETDRAWRETGSPAWFPSGDRILHMTGAVGDTRLLVRRADVAGEARELTAGRLARISPDGRTLVFMVDERGRGRLRRAPLLPDGSVGAGQTVFSDATEPNVLDLDLSPDGRVLAYTARQTDGRANVYVTEFAKPHSQLLVTDGGTRPRFSRDSGELFYLKGITDDRGQPKGLFMSVTVSSNPTIKIGAPVQLFEENATAGPGIGAYDVAADGKRFIMARPVAPAPGEGSRLVLVQNWRAGLTN
jgi:dipeptidyl aminopeptidase/acylaminoacyl peptidase